MRKNYQSLPQWLAFTAVFFLTVLSPLIAQQKASLEKLKSYLNANQQKLKLSTEDLNTLSITHEYTDYSTGVEHVFASQKINGLTVTNAGFSLHTSNTTTMDVNQLVSATSYRIKPVSVNVSSSQAILTLMQATGYAGDKKFEIREQPQGSDQVTVYKRAESSIWDIPARLVYYNNEEAKTLQPAWEIQMMDLYKKNYWLAYIEASSGKLLERRDLIMHCNFGGAETDVDANYHGNHKHFFTETSANKLNRRLDVNAIPNNQYRVYDLPLESPGDTLQQAAVHALSTRAGDPVASPDGWHRVNDSVFAYNYSRGNNVWAFHDPSPTPLGGAPDPSPARAAYPTNTTLGAPPVIEPFIFDYPINLNAQPEVYQKAAIVNLFYWNNLMHDVFYNLGFTEAAGNFQESHRFSTGVRSGGVPGDAVLAQAQDGGGTNNANFLTTPDGTPGQMQMYLWTAAFPDSLVQITSSSTGVPPSGKKFFAVQGSFNSTDTGRQNLYRMPVLNKQFVIIQKNPLSTVGSESEGCTSGQQSIALPPGNNVQDKIVLIDRGSCSFVEKVLSAQLGGAAGVIVINNSDGPPITMGGSDAPGNFILIPAVMISKSDGELLKAQIRAGAVIIGSLKRDTPPAPKRDGDLDNGVIAHEYGHGISTRLTAPNTVGPLGGSEQGGEGWSDFMGLYMTMRTNDLLPAAAGHPNGVLPTRSIGNYVTYQPANGRGIRPTPYSLDMSINPSTFKDIGRGGEISIPHGVGYVWATMLYEMEQELIDMYGMNDNVYEGAAPTAAKEPPAAAKGNNVAMRLVLEGIKLQGTSPTFVRQRNAILKADTMLYNAKHSCRIWSAFARRGLGFSASSGTNAVGDEFEAFDVPFSCNTSQTRIRVNKSGPVKANNGSQISYNISVTNLYATSIPVTLTDTLRSGLTFVSATDNPTVAGSIINWSFTLGANQTKTISLVTQLNAPASSVQVFGDDHEGAPTNWVVTAEPTFPGPSLWTRQSNASQAYSGTNYWFVPDPDGFAHTSLKTANPISIPANGELVFIHKFATEVGFDGGVVEVSEDNATWTYIPPTKFVRGGYNGVIPTTNNPAIGTSATAAFTGTSNGYMVSIANLNNYANKQIYIRFRFTADVGTGVEGGGWFMDDVYVLVNRAEIVNRATARTTPTGQVLLREGSNASTNESSAFVLGGSTLPSSLGPLTAAGAKQSVKLSWKSFNEVNTGVYEIERKGPGDADYIKIGNLSTLGSATQSKDYTFTDVNAVAGSRYYYRIKQVNKNGEFYYTNIAMVNLNGKEFAANIYPNPANNVANLSIINPGGGKVSINLFDVLGKKLATFNGAEAQSQVIPLPIQGLQAGTYWVEINTDEDHRTLKLEVKK
jgi:extracellular elastinolytic metalloproteinase